MKKTFVRLKTYLKNWNIKYSTRYHPTHSFHKDMALSITKDMSFVSGMMFFDTFDTLCMIMGDVGNESTFTCFITIGVFFKVSKPWIIIWNWHPLLFILNWTWKLINYFVVKYHNAFVITLCIFPLLQLSMLLFPYIFTSHISQYESIVVWISKQYRTYHNVIMHVSQVLWIIQKFPYIHMQEYVTKDCTFKF